MSLVSEYIHGVANDESEVPDVRSMAGKTWNCLKRSAKAGPRRTVRCVVLEGVSHCWDGHEGIVSLQCGWKSSMACFSAIDVLMSTPVLRSTAASPHSCPQLRSLTPCLRTGSSTQSSSSWTRHLRSLPLMSRPPCLRRWSS